MRKRRAAYRLANPLPTGPTESEKAATAKAHKSAWYLRNKERHRSNDAAWREKNKQKIKEYSKQYAALNRDIVRKAQAKYRLANKGYYYAKTMERLARKKMAVPKWADLEAIDEVYKEAKYHGLEVDHIVPLQSPLVCGLHVWDNLQLLPKRENIAKGNRHWPDMP